MIMRYLQATSPKACLQWTDFNFPMRLGNLTSCQTTWIPIQLGSSALSFRMDRTRLVGVWEMEAQLEPLLLIRGQSGKQICKSQFRNRACSSVLWCV